MQRTVHRTAVLTASTAMAGVALAILPLTGAHAAGDPQCPTNGNEGKAGCVYLNTNNGTRLGFYHYGAHNLSDVTGTGVLINDQTGSAVAYACTGYNGNGSCQPVKAGDYLIRDFTPINSIYLSAKPTH